MSMDHQPLLNSTDDADVGVEFRDRSVSTVQTTAGLHALQGIRPTMEDRHVVLLHPQFQEECKIAAADVPRSFFAVYDGHGGHVCAEYSKRNLHKNFTASRHFGTDTAMALRDACLTTDTKFIKAAKDLNLKSSSGTCAIIGYIEKNTLFIANVGDSRAVVCNKGRAIDMSIDHKPERADETRRVQENGGAVARTEADAFSQYQCCVTMSYVMCACMYSSPMRIYPGGLAVSRTIGDLGMKVSNLITAEPEIVERELTANDEFLILACDGVWDVLSSQEACDIVRRALQKRKTATEAATALAEAAYTQGSTDNISSIVVKFDL